MNHYLIQIESTLSYQDSIAAICKSDLHLSTNFFPPIFSLVDKFLDCFFQKYSHDIIGIISIYQLNPIEIDFVINYDTGKEREEEDIEKGKFYTLPIINENKFIATEQCILLKRWDSYEIYENHKKVIN